MKLIYLKCVAKINQEELHRHENVFIETTWLMITMLRKKTML